MHQSLIRSVSQLEMEEKYDTPSRKSKVAFVRETTLLENASGGRFQSKILLKSPPSTKATFTEPCKVLFDANDV